MTRIRESYSTINSGDPALWAAVNVVFALSHQLKAMQIDNLEVDHTNKALGFLQNATSVISEFSTQAPDTLGAQALVGIAKVLQGTSMPQNATMFLAMAVRQIYTLGLHKRNQQNEISPEALEWRRRVLWMAYTLDKDFSLKLEHPHALNDEELEANLPDWNPKDDLGFIHTINDTPRLNYFRLHVNLAIIQSRIYRRLYSAGSLHEVVVCDRTMDSVCDLVTALETWKMQIPVEFHLDILIETFPRSSIVAMVVLYLRYFNCLTMALRLAYWKVSQLETYKSSFDWFAASDPCPSRRLCIQAARTSLQLFTILPHGNVPCIW